MITLADNQTEHNIIAQTRDKMHVSKCVEAEWLKL